MAYDSRVVVAQDRLHMSESTMIMSQTHLMLETQLRETISHVGRTLGVSSAYIFENTDVATDCVRANQRCHWSSTDSPEPPVMPGLANMNGCLSGRWAELLGAAELIHGPVSAFPLAERDTLVANGIQAIAVAPVFSDERWWGFVAVADHQQARVWSPLELGVLETAAHALGALLENARLHDVMARLYESLQDQTEQLSRAIDDRTAELQTEQDRNLAILESAGEGIILTGVDGTILYANPAQERQSGYTRDELIGQNPRILSSGKTTEAVYKNMWETILQGRRWSGEIINRRKDGTLYDATLTIMPILDADGQVVNFVSVHADISHLKEVERLKNQFVANVSHELRTPLTNITMYLTLLEHGTGERRAHYLEILNRETARLTHRIQDLLDFSSLEMKPVQTEPPAASDLLAALQAHYEAFTAQADTKAVQFELEHPPTLPLVWIGEGHLGQLLTNLLRNAFTFTAAGGRVTLSAAVDGSLTPPMIRVQVADTGIGVPAIEMPNLFERFFRGQQAREMGAPGTGLGLAICQEILDRHGGRIKAESEPGAGSRFTIWLPVVE